MEKAPVVRLALYQGGTIDKKENLETARRVVAESKKEGATLVLFPELFLNGYEAGTLLHSEAESQDGPSIKAIQALAKEHQVAIVVGYSEALQGEGGNTHYYNSAIVINKDGEILVNYRKTHLWSDYEEKTFAYGDSLPPIVEIDGVRIGVLICWDIEFPEPARVLALNGAQLVLVPTASETAFAAEITCRSRAFENDLFIAYANRVRPSMFCGRSVIVGPDGEFLADAGTEGPQLLITDIQPSLPKYVEKAERNPFWKARKLNMYQELTSKQGYQEEHEKNIS